MRRAFLFLLFVVGCPVLVALFARAVPAEEPQAVSTPSRYSFYNGEWWYRRPSGKWLYWRANRWNDYSPGTFVPNTTGSSSSPNATAPADSGSQALPESDIRPFYGHALSQWGSGLSGEDEIAPFYGHAMPAEVFGGWRSRRFAIRPFYGHAASSDTR
jgi:hypothetical protein